MNVLTVLGSLTLAPLQAPGAEDCFSSAVRLGARDFMGLTTRMPMVLQQSGNLLARMWLGDLQCAGLVRAADLGQMAALAAWQAHPWVQGVSPDSLSAAYALLAEPSRRIRNSLDRARKLADQGLCEPLERHVMGGWADRYAMRLSSIGRYRAQTGCRCPDPSRCTCMTPAGRMS